VLKKSFLDGLQGLKPHSDVGNGPLMSRLKPRPTRLTAFFSTLLREGHNTENTKLAETTERA
jgi:hypothetical protein